MFKPAALPVLLLSLLLVACARPVSDPSVSVERIGDDQATSTTTGLGGTDSDGSALPFTTGEGDTVGETSGAAPVSQYDPLNQRVVYFAYDSSQLSAESRSVAEAHAQYMLNNPSAQIVLEGHADERGTREYNLALGERRARSVSEIMNAYGVETGRIQLISYGEEQPVALGSTEEAWRQNRRVELLYQ